MDESNDKYNWKKVFKKFLEPQTHTENEDTQRNYVEESISMGSFEDQEKSVAESSLISCSPVSTDSSYSGCKSEFHGILPPETDNIFESNMNFYKTNDCKKDSYNDLSSKKLPPREFQKNTLGASGCKPKHNYNIPVKMPSHDQNADIPHTEVLPESKQNYNIFHGKVPEWKTAFKIILSDNSSVAEIPHQKDIDPSKKTLTFTASDTPGTSCQGRQYMPIRRYKKAEKYKDYEELVAEKKAREIFARSRIFKNPHYNLNDFNGCGVDLFKKEEKPSTKYVYDSSNPNDKPYLPLTGCVAVSLLTPYTAADVAASYVPFEEDAWDDDLLI